MTPHLDAAAAAAAVIVNENCACRYDRYHQETYLEYHQ
jgi:hypothetical protein